jgi:hypothetical protein
VLAAGEPTDLTAVHTNSLLAVKSWLQLGPQVSACVNVGCVPLMLNCNATGRSGSVCHRGRVHLLWILSAAYHSPNWLDSALFNCSLPHREWHGLSFRFVSFRFIPTESCR